MIGRSRGGLLMTKGLTISLMSFSEDYFNNRKNLSITSDQMNGSFCPTESSKPNKFPLLLSSPVFFYFTNTGIDPLVTVDEGSEVFAWNLKH